MPKRSINLFNDADNYDDYKILDLFTEEEIMDNEEVSNFYN